MKKVDLMIEERLAPVISSMGYELFGCEWLQQGQRAVLCIYIDSPKGVTVDQCARVSQQVSALLDVEDLIQGHYLLEVSSPGIDRPLLKIEHYPKQVGQSVKIGLFVPIHQRKQFKGILVRVEGENVHLLLDNTQQEITLPFSAIERAHVIGHVRL